jgi:hypothetical protein
MPCTRHLLFCREILPCVDTGWANLVDIASVQGLNLITVQPGGMEAGLLCEHFFRTLLSPKTMVKSMLHTYRTSVHKWWTDIKFAGGSRVFE